MEEDWGQREPLYQRIANILRNEYPEGSQLQECLQNADDSGYFFKRFGLLNVIGF